MKKKIRIYRNIWGVFSNIGLKDSRDYYLLMLYTTLKGEPIPTERTVTVEQCSKALGKEGLFYINMPVISASSEFFDTVGNGTAWRVMRETNREVEMELIHAGSTTKRLAIVKMTKEEKLLYYVKGDKDGKETSSSTRV